MIQPQEMRIGNIVLFNGEIRTVDFLNKYSFNYDPIPLTEEWLLKFGFEKFGIYWDFEDVTFDLCEELPGRFTIELESDRGGNMLLEITTVHQLQNTFYYFSQGKELELKKESV